MGAFDRFPRVVNQLADLEEVEQQALRVAAEQDTFDFIVRFPPFNMALSKYAMRRKRGKTLPPTPLAHVWARQGDAHYLLTRTTAELRVAHFTVGDILTFELGEVLLHDWIELEIRDGASTRVAHVDFNAVGLDWIETLVNELRQRVTHSAFEYAPPQQAQIAQFPYKWQSLSLKSACTYGQAAQVLAFEPSIPPRWLRRMGREGKLLLLMPQHFVLVREPLETFPYGWITKSCLRSEVQDAHVMTTEQMAVLELTLGAHAFQWQIEMPRAHGDTMQQIADALQTVAAPISG